MRLTTIFKQKDFSTLIKLQNITQTKQTADIHPPRSLSDTCYLQFTLYWNSCKKIKWWFSVFVSQKKKCVLSSYLPHFLLSSIPEIILKTMCMPEDSVRTWLLYELLWLGRYSAINFGKLESSLFYITFIISYKWRYLLKRIRR